MTIRLVTDSTADIPADFIKRWNITVVPAYVNFSRGDGKVETLRDGIDIDIDTFYERLVKSDPLPTTSQPTIEDFFQVYEKLSSLKGDTVISVHVSSKLSGTYNSAFQAREHILHSDRVEIIDSGSASMGLGMAVLAGARAIEAGATVSLVIETIENALSQMQTYFVLDTLEYLQKGGRIGKAQAFVGSLLSVKPILTLEDGEVPAICTSAHQGQGNAAPREHHRRVGYSLRGLHHIQHHERGRGSTEEGLGPLAGGRQDYHDQNRLQHRRPYGTGSCRHNCTQRPLRPPRPSW